MRSAARQLPVLVAFAVLTVIFTWPLADRLGEAVLGEGAGDNMIALWNIWWARTAIRGSDSLFWTPALVAPLGTSLLLHSFAPIESVAAALLPAEPATAYNLTLLATVFLNLTCAYWAAWTLTRDRLAACFAAVTFAGAPCLLVRLHGHLNVLSAWGLPLLLIATRRYVRAPTLTTALALAGSIALLAYTDAYYATFGVILSIAYLTLSRSMTLKTEPLSAGRRRRLTALAIVIAAVCSIIVWIEWTGGTDRELVGIRLRMTDSFNPRVILGFLLAGAVVTWKWPVVSSDHTGGASPSTIWRLLPVVIITVVMLTSPLLVAAVHLWRAGDYESQVYFWRSAPPGIDLAALVLGNPLGWLSGGWTSAIFERLTIDRTESAAWIGLAPLVLLVFGIRRLGDQQETRILLWTGLLFFIWSLGPYLRLFGGNTGFMLPQTFARFVPIVANARVPGRAFVVVQLMIALLAARSLVTLKASPRYVGIALLAVAAALVDYWPAPHPSTGLEHSTVEAMLTTQPPGIVLEVPLGVRDGFGQRGSLDHMVLFYQTIHEHPQMGGFLARLSSRIKTAYDSDPIVGPILDLSEGKAPLPAPPALPAQCGLTCGLRYVVVNEAAASDELEAFVLRTFRLRLLGRSGTRALYVVE